ncbi:hypothetical protein ACVWZD_004047 [Streptomyces sp. TE3672]
MLGDAVDAAASRAQPVDVQLLDGAAGMEPGQYALRRRVRRGITELAADDGAVAQVVVGVFNERRIR